MMDNEHKPESDLKKIEALILSVTILDMLQYVRSNNEELIKTLLDDISDRKDDQSNEQNFHNN